MLSDSVTEQIHFTSTWQQSGSHREHVDANTNTEPPPNTIDQSVNTELNKTIETQTDIITEFAQYDAKKLAAFLHRIEYTVETELKKGTTPVFHLATTDTVEELTAQLFQVIKPQLQHESADPIVHGAATWLSICTQNTPLVAIASTPAHEYSWCQHLVSTVHVFAPRKSASGGGGGGGDVGGIQFEELTTLSTKSCVQVLATNQFNRDMFAAGTISGDLHIWLYDASATGDTCNEVAAVASEHGVIVGIAWLRVNTVKVGDYNVAVCHSNGTIVMLMMRKGVVMKDKVLKIRNRQKVDELCTLTTIVSVSETEFAVGTEEGDILMCSALNARPIGEFFDPILYTLHSHKFPVQSITKSEASFLGHNTTILPTLISKDLSGEMFFHEPLDSALSFGGRNYISTEDDSQDEGIAVLKMPLPYKSTGVCSNDRRFIISAGPNASLEFLRIQSSGRTHLEGTQQGKGNIIAVSQNGIWIVTGSYKGSFQISRIMNK